MAASSSSSSSSSSFPCVLSCLNFTLLILSTISLAPTIIIKSPPTLMGWALIMVSSTSLLSSFLGVYSQLTRFYFNTHITLLIASLAGQLLAILAVFLKEKSTILMLKSPRDPREVMVLVRLECGVLMVMFVIQMFVLCLSCGVRWCWVREYKTVAEESVADVKKKDKELEKMKNDLES